jgi:hypothetical protein
MNIPMNDFHVTEKAMAETARTTDARNVDLPYPQSADQLPTRVDPAEDSGNRKLQTRGERWRTGINEPFSMWTTTKAVGMLKFVIEGSGYKVNRP